MTSVPWDGEEALSGAGYSAVELCKSEEQAWILDQRRLPAEELYLVVSQVEAVASAIRDMVVRGAPAIGITAAYGMVLAARAQCEAPATPYLAAMKAAGAMLEATRPTAVNLAWAVQRTLELASRHASVAGPERWHQMAELARTIHRQDVAACHGQARR